MAHGESGEAAPGASSRRSRITAALVVSVIAFYLLPVYAFHLVWFSPEITSRSECDPKTRMEIPAACGSEHGEALWVGTFLVFVAGLFCLALTWMRMHGSRHWWPWPLTTMMILTGWFVARLLWLS